MLQMVEREEMHKDEIALLKTHLSEQTRVVLGGLSEDGRQDREKEAQFSQLLDRFNSLDQVITTTNTTTSSAPEVHCEPMKKE